MAGKKLFWLITILLILLAGYVLTTTVILPVSSKNPLPEVFVPKQEIKTEKNNKKVENVPQKSEKGGKGAKKQDAPTREKSVEPTEIAGSKDELLQLFELRKVEMLLKSRYKLSTEDSTYIVLDLIDKVVSLELKGVQLYKCKIGEFFVSNSISKYKTESTLRWMSQPFALKSVNSTIARVPIAVVNAPKDTTEANMKEAAPVAPKQEDVHIIMNFDRNLQLIIQQEELSEGESKMRLDSIKGSLVRKEMNSSLKSLSNLKREPVMPQIIINVPKADATIIYRALPQKPRMVLRM